HVVTTLQNAVAGGQAGMQDLLGPARWRLTGHWRAVPRHHEGDLAAEASLVKAKGLLALSVEIQVRIQRIVMLPGDLPPFVESVATARLTITRRSRQLW